MFSIIGFIEFLYEKKKAHSYISNAKALVEKFQTILSNRLITSGLIGEFIQAQLKPMHGGGAAKAAYELLEEYAEFSREEWPEFTDAFNEQIKTAIEEPTRKAVNYYKRAIISIPENTKINPFFLDGLTNEEFVDAFRALQDLIIAIYEEIERTSPFEWGWSGYNDFGAYGIYQNRVMNMLSILVKSGHLDRDTLVVNKKVFYANEIWKNRKIKSMIDGFMDMGLYFEGYDNKKSGTFTISCPDTPNLITVLCAYYKDRPLRDCYMCEGDENSPCHEGCDMRTVRQHWHIFSYRFVEEFPPGTHDTEIFFSAVTDSAPEELRKILIYVHEEAAKHGFAITEPWSIAHGGSIRYWRGSKPWLIVGSGTSWMDFYYMQQSNTWSARLVLDNVLNKYPEKVMALAQQFPDTLLTSKLSVLIAKSVTVKTAECINSMKTNILVPPFTNNPPKKRIYNYGNKV